jgi:hypothetical protein
MGPSERGLACGRQMAKSARFFWKLPCGGKTFFEVSEKEIKGLDDEAIQVLIKRKHADMVRRFESQRKRYHAS